MTKFAFPALIRVGALAADAASGPDDGKTWNPGAAWTIAKTQALDLRYYDTSEHDFGKLYDSRAAATLKAVF